MEETVESRVDDDDESSECSESLDEELAEVLVNVDSLLSLNQEKKKLNSYSKFDAKFKNVCCCLDLVRGSMVDGNFLPLFSDMSAKLIAALINFS